MGALTYILISLAFSAFFSGMEIAFISSNKLRFELDKKEKSLTSKILDIFYRNPHQFISTMLVGNNIALVIYGLQMAIILEPLIARVVNNEALIVLTQSIISTILILFTGEFIPKTVFKLNPNFSLTLFSVPLLIIYVVLYPVSKFSSLLSFLILKIAGVKNVTGSTQRALGKVDLDYFIQQSIEDAPQNSDMDTEVKIFQNALDFFLRTFRLLDGFLIGCCQHLADRGPLLLGERFGRELPERLFQIVRILGLEDHDVMGRLGGFILA